MIRSATGSPGARRPPAAGPALPERAVQLAREARWILSLALALFLLLILFTYDRADPGWSHAVAGRSIQNAGGRIGAWVADLLLYLFGLSAYLFVALLGLRVWQGYARLRGGSGPRAVPAPASGRRSLRLSPAPAQTPPAPPARLAWETWLGFAMLLLGSSALESARLHSLVLALPLAPGGLLGQLVSEPLHDLLGAAGGTLTLFAIIAAGISLWSGLSWLWLAEAVGGLIEQAWTKATLAWAARRDRRIGEAAVVEREEQVEELRRIIQEDPEPVRIETAAPIVASARAAVEAQVPLFVDLPAGSRLPALSLLDPPPPVAETVPAETLEYTSRLIEKKLADFNVAARVVAAYPGPVITRYEIEPATGVKGSQVVNLAKDLARALSLVSLRVVETIPGKNLMGLELPNPRRQPVRLSEILGSQVYADGASAVTLALGKDIAGLPVCADLARMPHLLVAGTTGSGKSVGINAMLLSLLYKSDPTQVRMILIDPKMLEMSSYEGIPHLLAPVVTDMKHAGNALNWCVAEMERRYRLLSKLGVRNLAGYNSRIVDAERRGTPIPNPFSLTPDAPEPLARLPQIVVVIDELADLMMVVGKKIEELIARLAQKARAAGIHLILATQRPSVDVITGLIKANIPTRIAFQVSSRIDSRTILDQMGAESLLGQGDMLYLAPGGGVPVRVHGAFVSDDEVAKVVAHWRSFGEPQYVEGVLEGGVPAEADTGSAVGFGGLQQTLAEAGVDGGESDAMYDQAVAVVVQHKRASISLVQRHLRIGYNRAARLLEQMEKAGLVSPMASNGNRDILVPRRDEVS
jgi:S-DNA-T family DNA segregation ATPase FtsK/SpoIIIE